MMPRGNTMKVGDIIEWWGLEGMVVEIFQDSQWGESIMRVLWFDGSVRTLGVEYWEFINANK
jgi:hypothetical protein